MQIPAASIMPSLDQKDIQPDGQQLQATLNAAAASSVAATMAAGSRNGPKIKQVAPNKSLQQIKKEHEKVTNKRLETERHEVSQQKNSALLAAVASAAARKSAMSSNSTSNSSTNSRESMGKSQPGNSTTTGRLQRNPSSIIPSKNAKSIPNDVKVNSKSVEVNSKRPALKSSDGSAAAAVLAFKKTQPTIVQSKSSSSINSKLKDSSSNSVGATSAATSASASAASAATASSVAAANANIINSAAATAATNATNATIITAPKSEPLLTNEDYPRSSSPNSIISIKSHSSIITKSTISKLKAEEGKLIRQRSESEGSSVHSDIIPISRVSSTTTTAAATATAAAKLAGATNKPLSVTALPPIKSDDTNTSQQPNSLPDNSGSALAAAMAARTTVVDTFEKINNDVNMKMDNKQQKSIRKKRRIYQPSARWSRSTHPTIVNSIHASEYHAPAPVRPSAGILATTNWIENIPDNTSVRSSSPDRGRSNRNQSPASSARTSQSRPRTYREEMSLSDALLIPHPWERELRNISTDSLVRDSTSPNPSPNIPNLPLPSSSPSRDSSKSPSNFDYFSYKATTNNSAMEIHQTHSAPITAPQSSTVSLSSTLGNSTVRSSHTYAGVSLAPSKSPNKPGFFSRFSSKKTSDRYGPAPTTLKSTMRKEHKHRNFNEDKPWKHHMDALYLTDREKKRYEGLWATNKGNHLKYVYEEEEEGEGEGEGEDSPDEQEHHHHLHHHHENEENERSSLDYQSDIHNPVDDIHGLIVRDIWRRSRIPDYILEQIWDLVDRHHDGTLDREGFLVGMWLVDQCLYGRKLPNKIDDKVWSSVGRLNVRIRLHKKEVKKENKKERKKQRKGE